MPVEENLREDELVRAKLAQEINRFDDLMQYMKSVVVLSTDDLTDEERGLLSTAFKNVITAKRTSWRVVSAIEEKESAVDASSIQLEAIRKYRIQIENELHDLCDEVLNLIESHLLRSAKSGVSRVFFYKMKGDYHRYLAEFTTGVERKDAGENCLIAYKTASGIATAELPPTNPVRLGLALNFSVFYYEILNSYDRAIRLAKTSFDDAIANLDSVPEDSYKETTVILQLLRDNLALWTAEMQNDISVKEQPPVDVQE